jgi:hypothetical protein
MPDPARIVTFHLDLEFPASDWDRVTDLVAPVIESLQEHVNVTAYAVTKGVWPADD